MLGIVPGEGLLKKNPAILDTTKTIGKSGWCFSVLKWDSKKGGEVRHKRPSVGSFHDGNGPNYNAVGVVTTEHRANENLSLSFLPGLCVCWSG